MQSEKSDEHPGFPPGTAYVLCAVPEDKDGVQQSYEGVVTAKHWDPDPAATSLEDGFFGLLWGAGDPRYVFSFNLAVVEVKEYVEVYRRPGVVKFKQGTVGFSGERHQAVARILELGADPERLAFQVSPEGANGIADAPAWGIARSKHGIARTGANGFAEVGSFGTALVDDSGHARAGDYGLASVYERGQAIAGFAGFAISRGEKTYNSFARAGDAGVAIGQTAVVGVQGKALGRDYARADENGLAMSDNRAYVGKGGIAIGAIVSGGPGSLLIATGWDDVADCQCFSIGVVGQDGITADQSYFAMGGKSTLTPTRDTGYRLPGEPEVRAACNALQRLIDSGLFAAESQLVTNLQILLGVRELRSPDDLAEGLKHDLLRSAHACGRRLSCATGADADHLLAALDDLVRALLPFLVEENEAAPFIGLLIQAYVARNREEASKWSDLLQT